jgi:hypothetical protein
LQTILKEKNVEKKFDLEIEVFKKAKEAAVLAASKKIQDNPGEWYPCGFASVKIKPARGKFVQMLKANKIGYTDTYGGGYVVSDPAQLSTQWMDAKLAGARAFAEVLNKNGIAAYAESMID